MRARQHHVHGAGIEVALRRPDHGRNIEAEPGTIEMHRALVVAVIEIDI